jgi:hypothetical protein
VVVDGGVDVAVSQGGAALAASDPVPVVAAVAPAMSLAKCSPATPVGCSPEEGSLTSVLGLPPLLVEEVHQLATDKQLSSITEVAAVRL